MRALIAIALMLCSACSALVASSPRDSPLAAPPSAAPSPLATDTPPSPTPAAVGEFKFIRWTGGYKIVASEPGGTVSASQDVHVDQIAGVLDSVQVDGVEWIRVQYGSDRAGDFVEHGWAPAEADIDRVGGIHVDRVYDYVVPDCPEVPTLADLGGMTPLQAVYCFGSRTLNFSPVQVREEGSEESELVQGMPEWLAEGGHLVAYWLPERTEAGSIRLRIDPASEVDVPLHEWIEISGRLDHPSAQKCERTSEYEGFALENEDEAVQLCRGRFVVNDIRPLAEAEIPPLPLVPGPEPDHRVDVSVRPGPAPVSTRHWSSTVWTGDQLLVWGGWDTVDDPAGMTDDGFTYTPATTEWAAIPAAPITPRARAQTSWSGSELLVWGGEREEDSPLSDGAAYNPVTGDWRLLSESPLLWDEHAASTWNGTEWWIASENGTGGVDVAAYHPAADEWRKLPTVPDIYADPPTLAWTGSETLLFTAAGLFSMSTDASDWVLELPPGELHAPAVWTGELLLLMASSPIGEEALDFDYLTHPVAWDPQTSAIVDLPPPPRNVFEPVVAGSRLAFFSQGLALDLTTSEWLGLDLDESGRKALDLVGNTAIWAGDRLMVWGGVDGCTGEPPKRDLVFELIPEWALEESSASTLSARRLAVRSPSATAGRIANSGWISFAC